tara:strand:+ start:469 stop:732 length:264 start_codon:yes stop_codon:yes gene_type:complete
MIYQKNLKKSKEFNDIIFLYNNDINYKSLKNCVILLTVVTEKNIVIIDNDYHGILFKTKFLNNISGELLKYFYNKDFEIHFYPNLTK